MWTLSSLRSEGLYHIRKMSFSPASMALTRQRSPAGSTVGRTAAGKRAQRPALHLSAAPSQPVKAASGSPAAALSLPRICSTGDAAQPQQPAPQVAAPVAAAATAAATTPVASSRAAAMRALQFSRFKRQGKTLRAPKPRQLAAAASAVTPSQTAALAPRSVPPLLQVQQQRRWARQPHPLKQQQAFRGGVPRPLRQQHLQAPSSSNSGARPTPCQAIANSSSCSSRSSTHAATQCRLSRCAGGGR